MLPGDAWLGVTIQHWDHDKAMAHVCVTCDGLTRLYMPRGIPPVVAIAAAKRWWEEHEEGWQARVGAGGWGF